jgi:DNA topoisomerase-3
LVGRRLLAALERDYAYESATILTKVGEHAFLSAGATPLTLGWRALYADEDADAKERLPAVEEGARRAVADVSAKAMKTKPPARLTDASLLQLMENAGKALEDDELRESMKEAGLGTSATRAATIERLLQVGYVQRQGKALAATEKGRRLIDAAPPEIASAETTGKWEKALLTLSRTPDPEARARLEARFSGGIERFCTFLVDYARTQAPPIAFDREEKTQKTRAGKRRVVRASGARAKKP